MIPGDVIVEELLETIVGKRTLVIMKVPLGEAVLRPFIARHPELHYYYFEQVGTGQEYYSSVREEILGHSFTYFSFSDKTGFLPLRSRGREKAVTVSMNCFFLIVLA